MNRLYLYRVMLIVVSGVSFVLAHEFGHFLAAYSFGLDPSFVMGSMDSGAGFLGFSVGISHIAATALEDFMVIAGATLLPLAIVLLLLGASALTGTEELTVIAEIYLILVVINLVPVPGVAQLDANKIWGYLSL